VYMYVCARARVCVHVWCGCGCGCGCGCHCCTCSRPDLCVGSCRLVPRHMPSCATAHCLHCSTSNPFGSTAPQPPPFPQPQQPVPAPPPGPTPASVDAEWDMFFADRCVVTSAALSCDGGR